MSWSPDGELLASGSWDQTVQVWSSGSGTRLFTYRGHTESVNAIVWSPEGTWLASGDLDDQAHVWQPMQRR